MPGAGDWHAGDDDVIQYVGTNMSGYGVNICISADLNYINFSPCPAHASLTYYFSQLYKVIQLSERYYKSSSKLSETETHKPFINCGHSNCFLTVIVSLSLLLRYQT